MTAIKRLDRWTMFLGILALPCAERGLCHWGPTAAAFAAQTTAAPPPVKDEAQKRFDEALSPGAADSTQKRDQTSPAAGGHDQGKTLLELFFAGGILMYPIALMSLIVVAFTIERLIGLRRRKIIPPELVDGFGSMAANPAGFDPRQAYRLCQQYPSAAANVIRALLLKIGRPHSEVEHAVAEASDREATRLYSNVRPIALAISVSPLLGLLGTVQGMIQAFYVTAYSGASANKTQQLAEGIWTALITTFGGLSVAIPASIAAYYFEGRIVSLFRDIDELAQSLLPQVERYEGKLRVSRQQLAAGGDVPPLAEPTRQPS